MKKEIIELFHENGLKITIDTGLKCVDFLDVTLDLYNKSFRPFRKPNDEPLYVNKNSNHPNTVTKHIPKSINARLSSISSNEVEFNRDRDTYHKALSDSGYTETLEFAQNRQTNSKGRKLRKRHILWYNPPYNSSVRTDLGRKFLGLIEKHFPKDHRLHKIMNRNNVKLSYSCTKNMKRIIQSHNNKVLGKKKENTPVKSCSCPKKSKDKCPLNGKCLKTCIIYKANVKKSNKFYLGSTETSFKSRYANHIHSFRHETGSNATALSQHIWEIKDTPNPTLEWEVVKTVQPCRPGLNVCDLCLEEKLNILKHSRDPNCLNKRSELNTKCRHKTKFKLNKIMI